ARIEQCDAPRPAARLIPGLDLTQYRPFLCRRGNAPGKPQSARSEIRPLASTRTLSPACTSGGSVTFSTRKRPSSRRITTSQVSLVVGASLPIFEDEPASIFPPPKGTDATSPEGRASDFAGSARSSLVTARTERTTPQSAHAGLVASGGGSLVSGGAAMTLADESRAAARRLRILVSVI